MGVTNLSEGSSILFPSNEEERNRVFRVPVNGHNISSQPIGLCLSHMPLLFFHFVVEAPFLGAFAKLRTLLKVDRFLVCPYRRTPFPPDDFHGILCSNIFRKSVEEINI